MIFRILDYNNNFVILTKQTWYKKLLHPIFGHPEVKSLLVQIKQTIKTPDYIYQSLRHSSSKLLFTKIRRGTFASYFLAVVVKYLKDKDKITGYISTVMINRRLPKSSKLLWERKVLI